MTQEYEHEDPYLKKALIPGRLLKAGRRRGFLLFEHNRAAGRIYCENSCLGVFVLHCSTAGGGRGCHNNGGLHWNQTRAGERLHHLVCDLENFVQVSVIDLHVLVLLFL